MVSRIARVDFALDLPMASLNDLNPGKANVGVEILC
jgi:hypothetical protein